MLPTFRFTKLANPQDNIRKILIPEISEEVNPRRVFERTVEKRARNSVKILTN